MDPVSTPTLIVAGLLILLLVLLYLMLRRHSKTGPENRAGGEILRLEPPESPRPASRAAVESMPVPEPAPEPLPLIDDPELIRLHERAKRRARTVVREIMMYNEEKLEKGRREGNLAKYLGREIEMSRKLYQASIDLPDADSARYFDESLLAILAGGNPSLLRGE